MNTYKAQITSNPSKVMTKANGSEYVLLNALILEGPAKGKTVASTRTIKNVEGVEKSVPEIGTEVTLYHQALESSSQPGKFVHFFEVSTGQVQASNDELTDIFGVEAVKAQAIGG